MASHRFGGTSFCKWCNDTIERTLAVVKYKLVHNNDNPQIMDINGRLPQNVGVGGRLVIGTRCALCNAYFDELNMAVGIFSCRNCLRTCQASNVSVVFYRMPYSCFLTQTDSQNEGTPAPEQTTEKATFASNPVGVETPLYFCMVGPSVECRSRREDEFYLEDAVALQFV